MTTLLEILGGAGVLAVVGLAFVLWAIIRGANNWR